MKTITLFFALLGVSALSTFGQGTKGGQALVEFQTGKKAKEEKKAPVTPPKPTSEILGKQVIYGGFLTEFLRAERKRPFLSLRTPVNYQKDLENLIFYPGTETVQGFVLFSIKF